MSLAEQNCLALMLKLMVQPFSLGLNYMVRPLNLNSITKFSNINSLNKLLRYGGKKLAIANSSSNTNCLHLDIKSSVNTDYVSNTSEIPLELVSEILSRLPINDVRQYRYVCKSWRDEIDSKQFIKAHTANHKSGSSYILLHTYIWSLAPPNWYYLDFNSTKLSPFPIPLIPKGFHRAVGYCNGLLCLMESSFAYTKNTCFWLCNPATGSRKIMPELIPPDYAEDLRIKVGFGYDYISDDYKILCLISYRHGLNSLVQERSIKSWVYGFKSNSWKNIQTLGFVKKSFNSDILYHSFMIFANNALHWLNSSKNNIISFNLGTEKFHEIITPSASPNDGWYPQMKLAGLRGRLHLVKLGWSGEYEDGWFRAQQEFYEIWIMSEYHVQWTKLIRINDVDRTFNYFKLIPLPLSYAYSKDGKEIIIGLGSTTIWTFLNCDLITGELKELEVTGVPYNQFTAMPLDCFSLISV